MSSTLNFVSDLLYNRVYNRCLCRVKGKIKHNNIVIECVLPPFGSVFPRNTLQRKWMGTRLYQKWQDNGWCIAAEKLIELSKEYPELRDRLLEDISGCEELVGEDIHKEYWR